MTGKLDIWVNLNSLPEEYNIRSQIIRGVQGEGDCGCREQVRIYPSPRKGDVCKANLIYSLT